MNLIDILMDIPDIKETDGQKNPTIYLKFQNILGRGTWYVTEMGATDTLEPDVLMYGYVISPLGEDCDEWGYFTLSELKQTNVILLDSEFEPSPLKKVMPEMIT